MGVNWAELGRFLGGLLMLLAATSVPVAVILGAAFAFGALGTYIAGALVVLCVLLLAFRKTADKRRNEQSP